jgi:class 3 adenylate cyclase
MPPDPTGDTKVQRKLAAILIADIAGYSALMGANEEATVRDLKAHQAVILPMIGGHRGRVIDTAGDGILAEFPSVLGAVKCALMIQQTMAARNAPIDPGRRMQFRIGINQGDVVVEDARVYGDGVNIAARLESLAEPGGICISGKVYDEISGKVDLICKDGGPQRLKNIEDLVRVYHVVLPTSAEQEANLLKTFWPGLLSFDFRATNPYAACQLRIMAHTAGATPPRIGRHDAVPSVHLQWRARD